MIDLGDIEVMEEDGGPPPGWCALLFGFCVVAWSALIYGFGRFMGWWS
jgi:hypothetical protein